MEEEDDQVAKNVRTVSGDGKEDGEVSVVRFGGFVIFWQFFFSDAAGVETEERTWRTWCSSSMK